MTGTVDTHATHGITRADLAAWLTTHGLDLNDVVTAVIRVDRVPCGYTADVTTGNPNRNAGAEFAAWLDVEWYKRDSSGHFCLDETGDNAARGQSSIPLASFPRLTAG